MNLVTLDRYGKERAFPVNVNPSDLEAQRDYLTTAAHRFGLFMPVAEDSLIGTYFTNGTDCMAMRAGESW
jgi:hypothetical protein